MAKKPPICNEYSNISDPELHRFVGWLMTLYRLQQ